METGYNGSKQPRNGITVTHEGKEAVVTLMISRASEKRINEIAHRLRRLSKVVHTHISPLVSHSYSRENSCLSLRYFVGDAVQLSEILANSTEQNSAKPRITETAIIGLLLHTASALGFVCNPIRAQLMNISPEHHSLLSPDFLFLNERTRMVSVVAVGVYWSILQSEESGDATSALSYEREKEDVLRLGQIINNIIGQSDRFYSGLLKRIVNTMLDENPRTRPDFASLSIFLSSLVELQQNPQYRPTALAVPVDKIPSPRVLRRSSSQIPNYQRSPSPTYDNYIPIMHQSTNIPRTSYSTKSPTEHFGYTAPIKRPVSVLEKPLEAGGRVKPMKLNAGQFSPGLRTCPRNPIGRDMRNTRGINLLFDSVESNNIEEVRRVKEMFARGTDSQGNTALMRALQLRSTDIAMELLSLEYMKRNSKGQLPLMISLAEKMDAVTVELLLNYDEFYGTVDDDGNTALMYAVMSHSKKAVEALAPYEHNIPNKEGKYPIHVAIEAALVDIALCLLEYNSNILDKEYRTLSEYCDIYKCALVKDRLLTINRQESSAASDYTTLMVAAGLNNIDEIYKHIPSQVGMRHSSGETALMIAIRKNQLDAIRILLPYEFHLPDKAGHFFVYLAGLTGSRQVIRCVLDSLFTDSMLMCLQLDDQLSEIAAELRTMIEDTLTSNDQDVLHNCIQDLDSIISHQVEAGAIATYYDDLWVGPSTPLMVPESAIHLGEADLDIHALDVSNARTYAEASTSSQPHDRTAIHNSEFFKPSHMSASLKGSKSVASSKLGYRSPNSLVLSPTVQNSNISKLNDKVSILRSEDLYDRSSSTENLLTGERKTKTLLTASSVGFKELSESLRSSSTTLFSADVNEYGNTPLTCSVLNSDINSVKSFAKRYACSLNNKGETALHTALQMPDNATTVEMVRVLAPLEWNVSSSSGTYPTDVAAIRMLREAFLILVEHDTRYSAESVSVIKKAIDEGDIETIKRVVRSKQSR